MSRIGSKRNIHSLGSMDADPQCFSGEPPVHMNRPPGSRHRAGGKGQAAEPWTDFKRPAARLRLANAEDDPVEEL